MKFLFCGCMIICYNHNDMIKLITFFWQGWGHWVGEGQLPLLLFLLCLYSTVRCVLCLTLLFILISDEIFIIISYI